MKLSIIIPCYNSEKTIAKCLIAIENSSYQNYEVIIVDDHSLDDTTKIVKQFKCKLIFSKINQGTCISRNLGAGKAKGEILVFLDSDILIQEDTFKKIVDQFKKQKEISAIVGIYSSNHPYNSISSRFKNLHLRYTYAIMPNYISILNTSLCAIKKSVFDHVCGFDKNIKFSSDDWDLGRRISERGYKIFLDKHLEVVHNKPYFLYKLLRTDFIKARSVIKYVLRSYSKTTLNAKRCGSIPIIFLLNSPLCFFLFCEIVIFLIYPSFILSLLTLLTIESYLLANFNFLCYLYKRSGLKFALYSSIILFLNIISISSGGFVGLVDFFLFDKHF